MPASSWGELTTTRSYHFSLSEGQERAARHKDGIVICRLEIIDKALHTTRMTWLYLSPPERARRAVLAPPLESKGEANVSMLSNLLRRRASSLAVSADAEISSKPEQKSPHFGSHSVKLTDGSHASSASGEIRSRKSAHPIIVFV